MEPEKRAADAGAASAAETEEPLEAVVARARTFLALFDVEGYEEAVPLLREAIERGPDYAPAYAALAETYAYWGFRREIAGEEAQSLYDMALEHAEVAVRLAPESAEAHRAVAVALRRGEKADGTRRQEEILVALDLDPRSADAWYEYWHVRGYDPDDEAVKRVFELDPKHLGLHIDLGAALVERGRLGEAGERLMEALRLNPRNTLAAYDLAMVFDREGRREQAVDLLRRLQRLHPEERLLAAGLAAVEGRHGG